MSAPRPRVLVTDAEERSSLAVCRSLQAAGYRVSALAGTRAACAHWSRSVEERLRLHSPRRDPGHWVSRLAGILASGGYDLLVPGTEASLIPVSEHRDLLEPYVHLGLPAHETVLRALDKSALVEASHGTGLDAPASVECAQLDQAFAVARSFGFPAVVKPIRSFLPAAGTLRQTTARIVRDELELAAAASVRGLPLTVQEYLPSATIVSCAGVRARGRVAGLTVVRYERTYPADVGSAALARTIVPPTGVTAGVEEILARIGWEGIFELELLETGGRFATIDLNPRPFGWLTLAVEAGADLPALWCDHVLGRPQRASSVARPGVVYRWEVGEFAYVLDRLRRGRLPSALRVLRPYRRVAHAQFRLRDPLPLVARVGGLAVRRVLRPIRRVFVGRERMAAPQTNAMLPTESVDPTARSRG